MPFFCFSVIACDQWFSVLYYKFPFLLLVCSVTWPQWQPSFYNLSAQPRGAALCSYMYHFTAFMFIHVLLQNTATILPLIWSASWSHKAQPPFYHPYSTAAILPLVWSATWSHKVQLPFYHPYSAATILPLIWSATWSHKVQPPFYHPSSAATILPLIWSATWSHTLQARFYHRFPLVISQVVPNVRGVNTIKCECVNKKTTIRARRMFIS
jgi:hypothetical protein